MTGVQTCALPIFGQNHPADFHQLCEKTQFEPTTETSHWQHIKENLYLPYNEELGVFVQHDGFMEKELIPVKDLEPSQRPINQKWSWDRILRSVYIKQADVLQGLYFLKTISMPIPMSAISNFTNNSPFMKAL